MYESPITLLKTDPLIQRIKDETDTMIFQGVARVGVHVDKDELIKALEYDRGQYEKGFHDGRMYVPPCPSNADRIRSMTDEEMADLFDTWIRDCDSNDVPCRTFCLQGCSNCEKNWLRWLKQKAEEGE